MSLPLSRFESINSEILSKSTQLSIKKLPNRTPWPPAYMMRLLTHRRLSYPWRVCISAEPRCVSPSELRFRAASRSGKSFEHQCHARKTLGVGGLAPERPEPRNRKIKISICSIDLNQDHRRPCFLCLSLFAPLFAPCLLPVCSLFAPCLLRKMSARRRLGLLLVGTVFVGSGLFG